MSKSGSSCNLRCFCSQSRKNNGTITCTTCISITVNKFQNITAALITQENVINSEFYKHQLADTNNYTIIIRMCKI